MLPTIQNYRISTANVTFRAVKGKKIFFSTEDLSSLNDRQAEAYSEIILMTDRILQGILSKIRTHITWIYTLAESVALLDVLVCFANFVTVNDGYTRPILSPDGPIAVKNGRHPVLESAQTISCVPNSVCLDELNRFMLIVGPNGVSLSLTHYLSLSLMYMSLSPLSHSLNLSLLSLSCSYRLSLSPYSLASQLSSVKLRSSP